MKHKLALIGVGLLLTAFIFYWFQWRPSQIKHSCSWVKRTEDAIPERPALSEAELKAKGLLKNCSSLTNDPSTSDSRVTNFFDQLGKRSNCEGNNKWIIEDYKTAKPAKSAREWYVKSTDEEYKFCLRDKGL